MFRLTTGVCLMALAFAILATDALAFRVTDFSTKEKIHLSDLVVSAVVTSSYHAITNERGFTGQYLTYRVVAVVKGRAKAGDSIEVLVRGSFSELNIHDAVVGGQYLLFLRRNGQDRFSSVNGPYGAYRLDGAGRRR